MTDVIQSSAKGGAQRLLGKDAIVTGAARGIGRAVAVAFAREGADVMGIDVAGPVSSTLEVMPATPDELAETGRLIEAAGTRWREACLDQRDLTALRVAAERASVIFGRLDILFANAGIQSFKPILEWKDSDWHDQIDVNLTGTCNAIRAVAPHLVKNGGGRIIVTSSTQGRHGTQIRRRIFRIQMGHHRIDEIGGAGVRHAFSLPRLECLSADGACGIE